MAGYTPERKSGADLLAIVVDRIDSAASAVDPTDGKVTSETVWTAAQKASWTHMWFTGELTCQVNVT